MDLVNNKDDVALLAYLFDKPLHAALKLASKLCACYQSCKIKEKYLLILELVRNIAGGDQLGETFRYSCFSDTGLADKTRIVFLTPVKYLYDSLQLLMPADHSVKLALASPVRQIDTVLIQKTAGENSAVR